MAATDRKRLAQTWQTAQALHRAGRLGEALVAYKAVLSVDPTRAEAHFQIGRIHAAERRLPDARAAIEAAIKLRPTEEVLWIALADLVRAGAGVAAPAALAARARKAGLPPEALDRVLARLAPGRTPGAEPPVPPAAQSFLRRAGEATRTGDDEGARRMLDRALEKAPGAPALLIRRAETLRTLGRLDAAEADARAAVTAAPEVGGYWRVWAGARRIAAGEPLVADLERRHAAAAEGGEDRRQMAFALAKAMEDTGAHDRVFGFLNEANALTARRFPYNHAADLETAERLRRAWSPGLAARWAGKGDSSVAPIFVTGMPRSGTTLVEQILASHSQVAGGGEMGLIYAPLAAVAERVLAEGTGAGAGLAEAGRAYAAEIARRFPGMARVTDKSIATYAVLGFVPLALPRAKIVVVRRDPRDTCLSVLKTQFADGQHRYSYSMQATAAFYRLFAGQVAFWRSVVPEAFVEVEYEALVADPEAQTRRLLEACGLDWEDSCLEFHRTDRGVRTLSASQVRQPMYASSVGAWRRYEADLAPLLAALGPPDRLP